MANKKTHRVYARDQKAQLDGLETSRGKINFGTKTAVYVDKETAEEVDARYGMKSFDESVIVAKDEQYERALNGEKWDIIPDKKNGDWVKTLHKWQFQGVDTSHFVRPREGRVKMIGSVEYVYVNKNKKLVLVPKYEIQKRDSRRKGAEENET